MYCIFNFFIYFFYIKKIIIKNKVILFSFFFEGVQKVAQI